MVKKVHRFKKFMRSQKWSGECREFYDDAIRDDELPDPDTWEELETYLRNLANPQLLDNILIAGRQVWNRYVYVRDHAS